MNLPLKVRNIDCSTHRRPEACGCSVSQVCCFLNSVHSGGFAVAGLWSASMKDNRESTARSLNAFKAFLRWSLDFLFRGVCVPDQTVSQSFSLRDFTE